MVEVERMAVVIKPTVRFLDWLNNVFPKETLKLQDLQDDNTMILIPVFESEAEIYEYFEDIYKTVFESELESWNLDEETWPKNRTYQLFKEYFDLELHSIVYDTVLTENEEYEMMTLQ